MKSFTTAEKYATYSIGRKGLIVVEGIGYEQILHLLKKTAQNYMYFDDPYLSFYEIDSTGKAYKITGGSLKEKVLFALTDKNFFNKTKLTIKQLLELADFVRLPAKYRSIDNVPFLQESKTCQMVKGSIRKNSNKYVKTYARKRK